MRRTELSKLTFSTIADTVSGVQARNDPGGTLAHYERLAQGIWLPDPIRALADGLFAQIKQGTSWASLSGDFGFGKTSASIALWQYATEAGYICTPPLSCTSFDELTFAIAALVKFQHPGLSKKIDKLLERIWTDEIKTAAKRDAERYGLTPSSVGRLLHGKFQAGELRMDGEAHRLVEFLAALADIAEQNSKGLIVILDELQQLLGPLDAKSIVEFREFVWGFRTEDSKCGIVISMDAVFESRLARWAEDILHRIREQSPALQMSTVYTREFPSWIWNKLCSNADERIAECIDPSLLKSLGQFIERADLASGPRSTVDVLDRAYRFVNDNRTQYDLLQFARDLEAGVFRYFGNDALVQKTLIQLSNDEWIQENEDRSKSVKLFALFPNGLPDKVWSQYVLNRSRRKQLRDELFGPLLIELLEGPALERLQNVRRRFDEWEGVAARSLETLPSFEALHSHIPHYLWRILIPVIFPNNPAQKDFWSYGKKGHQFSPDVWNYFVGSYDKHYPERDVAVWINQVEPNTFPKDVDLCISFICGTGVEVEPTAKIEYLGDLPHIRFEFSVFRTLQNVPKELERLTKYIAPEPFNTAIILFVLHDIASALGEVSSDKEALNKESLRAQTFVRSATELILSDVLNGVISVDGIPIPQQGIELLRAFFSKACRVRFEGYESLLPTTRRSETLDTYIEALKRGELTDNQRVGKEPLKGTKAAILEYWFGQKSSASGDSFLRVLGSLISSIGVPDAFEVTLSPHPGELEAVAYLKRVARKRGVDVEAVGEYLRHRGYLKRETGELVRLLQARGLVYLDGKNELRLIHRSDDVRSALVSEIQEKTRELIECRQSIVHPNVDLTKLSAAELGKLLDERRLALEGSYSDCRSELKILVGKLLDSVGSLVASDTTSPITKTQIHQHLTGVQEHLDRTKQGLLRNMRKFLANMGEITRIADRDIVSKGDRVREFLHECEEAVTKYFDSHASFAHWNSLNLKFQSVHFLVDKVSQSEPECLRVYDDILARCRESFSTAPFETLTAAKQFELELDNLQARVQRLLYSLLRRYYSETYSLQAALGRNLATDVWIADLNGNEETPENRYRELYTIVFRELNFDVEKCRAMRASGIKWTSSDGYRWKELNQQVSSVLETCQHHPTLESLTDLAHRVAKLRSGFENASSLEEYYDELSPPDFERLKKRFDLNEISILVRRKD